MPKKPTLPEASAGTPPPGPWTVSQLGRCFGLSRSALLYYDRIGLLKPSGRTRAGYRCYTEADRLRLERICGFRRAGLSLAEIRTLLASAQPAAAILERRFHEIGAAIRGLRAQQEILSRMLTGIAAAVPPVMNRELWVAMLRAAGMDDRAMAYWHAEFERRAPEAHRDFLRSLGIAEGEVTEIRRWSRLTAEKRGGPQDREEPVVETDKGTDKGKERS